MAKTAIPTGKPTLNPVQTKPTKVAPVDNDHDEDEDEKEPKIPRVSYSKHEAAKADLADDGRLKCVPSAFDGQLHLAPKKGDFVDEADFLDFRATQAETRAQELVERSARDRETATAIRRYGDPAQRAAIAKRQKMLAEVAALEAGLIAEGVELPPPPMIARKPEAKPEANYPAKG